MLEQVVTSNLAPITGKLGKMIRMLASDCDGDVIAAARAIKRTPVSYTHLTLPTTPYV